MDFTGYVIVDEFNGVSRVTKKVDNKTKWGLLAQNGDVVLPAVYDYIDTLVSTTQFRVFKGDFEWDEYDEETADLFYDFICDRNSWNGDYYEATLGKGCWGLVNNNNEIIIPVKYNSLHFYSDSIFIVNENGSRIIKWFCGDDKEWNWGVVGGNWKALNTKGETIAAMDSQARQFEFYTFLNKLQPWDNKFTEGIVGAYFKS